MIIEAGLSADNDYDSDRVLIDLISYLIIHSSNIFSDRLGFCYN